VLFVACCVFFTAMGVHCSHPSSDPPRSVCHFTRLSSIECQLVLQMLDCTSRLRAARCCRSLLRDADDPFTWRSDSTVLVSAEQVTRAMHYPQRSSLSRHVETLRVVGRQGQGSAPSWGGLLALVRPRPVDREIEIALTNLLNKSRLGAGTNLKRVDIFAPVLPSCELISALACEAH